MTRLFDLRFFLFSCVSCVSWTQSGWNSWIPPRPGSTWSSLPPGERPDGLVPLPHQVASVRAEPFVAVDSSGRPAHLESFDLGRCPQSEVESRIAGRLVT